MLALSEKRITRDHHRTAAVAAVVNVMVVFLYWKLFFTDPSLVNGRGPIPWHQQYYLHGLGPALQIIDALFIAQVFRKPLKTVVPLVSFVVVYLLWSELFVQRFNDTPAGSVTSGLPYPFLNSLELTARMGFYVTNVAVAIGVLAALTAICWVIRRGLWQSDADTQQPATQ